MRAKDADAPAEGPYARRMREKLTEVFDPIELEIVDDSESHRGHGGYRDGGETHFKVHLRSKAFDGKSRVQRHRAVMTLLKPELEERVHALNLSLLSEGEG